MTPAPAICLSRGQTTQLRGSRTWPHVLTAGRVWLPRLLGPLWLSRRERFPIAEVVF